MRMFRTTPRLATITVALAMSTSAFAAGTVGSKDAPDLKVARAMIKAKNFKGAIVELMPYLATHEHADVYNLLGFSLRKTGDYKQAATYYAKALDYDPVHKGALEYQGQMFVELGEMDKAKANLAKLVSICPKGCEERQDLEKAIAKAAKPVKTN